MRGSARCRVQGKAPAVAAEVEHRLALAKRAQEKSALSLIGIESCLLPRHRRHELDAILHHLDLVERTGKVDQEISGVLEAKAFILENVDGRPPSDGRNAAGSCSQGFLDGGSVLLDPRSRRRHYQMLPQHVGDQTRQAVALAVDQAEDVGVARGQAQKLAELHSCRHSREDQPLHVEKARRVAVGVGLHLHDADAVHGVVVVDAPGEGLLRGVRDEHGLARARRRLAHHAIHRAAVHHRAPVLEHLHLALLQHHSRHAGIPRRAFRNPGAAAAAVAAAVTTRDYAQGR
ncbi:hypothetical protein Mapa_012282 [Marchantia paleacea]|nr:hypothetical protein Mapa_012282 [Marchantia paleacea]